jgi:hypothetical protein
VLYQDGRFSKDKMWGFFALNFLERRTNQWSGAFFVDTWLKDGEVSVEELKEKLRKGETQWIDIITCYLQRVRGSSAF